MSGSARIPSRLLLRLILLTVTLLVSAHISLLADSTSNLCTISFPTVPDSVIFYVNGLEKQSVASGNIYVEPGPVLIELKRSNAMVYSAIFILDSSEKKEIPLSCTEECALLHITTEPSGATISMDGTILGTSPYLNGFITPGSSSFMVTYPGKIPIIRRVNLSTDSVQYFSFAMEYTQALKDSVSAARRALKQKNQIISGSLFGGAALAMIAGGAYYDHKAYNYLLKADRASSHYDMATTPEQCDNARDDYNTNRTKAERPVLYRDLLYSAAGLCVIGFYLSFVF